MLLTKVLLDSILLVMEITNIKQKTTLQRLAAVGSGLMCGARLVPWRPLQPSQEGFDSPALHQFFNNSVFTGGLQ